METICVGTYVNTHGIRGEIKVKAVDDDFDYDVLYFEKGPKGPQEVVGIRRHKGLLIVKLAGIDDINAIEKYKGSALYAEKKPIEEEGTYYVSQLIGCRVVDEEGCVVGVLKDVLTERAQPLYVIADGEDEWYLPGVKPLIKRIDLAQSTLYIAPPAGWRE